MRKTLLAFAAIAALAACGQTTTTTATTTATDTPIQTDVAPYVAIARVEATGEMEALTHGVLQIVDGCVRVKANEADPGALVVFPFGTTVDASTGAVIIKKGESGVAVGDTVEISGGGVSTLTADAVAAPVPAACTGPYWIAGSSFHGAIP